MLPDLVLQTALRSNPGLRGRPVVVGGVPSEPRPVLACSDEAVRAGVQPGMRLKEAQSCCPEAVFLPEMPEAVLEAIAQIEARLAEISPLVEATLDGRFWVGLDGSRRMWPDEATLAAHIKTLVKEYGPLSLRIGIADTKYAALVAALASDLLILPPGKEACFLAEQPIDRLPAAPATIDALHALGIDSLGAFAALPSNAVAMRFGKEGRTLQLLARGVDETPVVVPTYTPPIRSRIAFDGGETVRQRLLWRVEQHLARLYRQMDRAALTARALCLTLFTEGGIRLQAVLPIQDPLLGLAQLQQLLRWRLETIELPAPVEELIVELAGLQWMEGRQLDLFSRRQEGDVRRLLSELVARWGIGRIMQPRIVQSRRVEAAFLWAEPELTGDAGAVVALSPRPVLRLLPEPRPIEVSLHDERPVMLVLGSCREAILAFAGPWRLNEGWWDTLLERDEYQLCTASSVYYAVHDRSDDRWSLLGAFD